MLEVRIPRLTIIYPDKIRLIELLQKWSRMEMIKRPRRKRRMLEITFTDSNPGSFCDGPQPRKHSSPASFRKKKKKKKNRHPLAQARFGLTVIWDKDRDGCAEGPQSVPKEFS